MSNTPLKIGEKLSNQKLDKLFKPTYGLRSEKIIVTRKDDENWNPQYYIEDETPLKRRGFNQILRECGESASTLLQDGETSDFQIRNQLHYELAEKKQDIFECRDTGTYHIFTWVSRGAIYEGEYLV